MQTFTINLKEHYGYLDKSEGLLDAYIPNVTPEIDRKCYAPQHSPLSRRRVYVLLPPEAEPVALNFLAKGYNVFILYYSVFEKSFPYPQLEVLSAVRLIREKAHEWHCAP